MKLLIVYSGKNGTVRECIRRLEIALHNIRPTVVCLEQETPSLEDFDVVIVGGSVYFGRFRPALRRFLKEQEQALSQKALGMFLCCGLAHEWEYYREKLFPRVLRDRAFQTLYFGGVLKLEACSLFDRYVLHSMRASILESEINDGEYTPSLPGILPENIERMATYIRQEFVRNDRHL